MCSRERTSVSSSRSGFELKRSISPSAARSIRRPGALEPRIAETTTLASRTKRIALSAARSAHGIDLDLDFLLTHGRKAVGLESFSDLDQLAAGFALKRVTQSALHAFR